MRLLPGLCTLAICWNECSESRRLKTERWLFSSISWGRQHWVVDTKSALRLCDVQEGGAAEGGRYLIRAKRCRSAGSRDGEGRTVCMPLETRVEQDLVKRHRRLRLFQCAVHTNIKWQRNAGSDACVTWTCHSSCCTPLHASDSIA